MSGTLNIDAWKGFQRALLEMRENATSQINIRQLDAKDAESWRQIRLESLENTPEAFGQTLESASQQTIEDFRQTVAGPFPPFAAFDGTKLIGVVGFYILNGSKMSHRGMLWGMYVSPTHRGRGIGRQLVQCVIDHAQARVRQIHLHVVSTNAAAYRLYRNLGFLSYGVEPRALRHADRDFDEIMMVLMLDN